MSLTPDIERVLSEHRLHYTATEGYHCHGSDCRWKPVIVANGADDHGVHFTAQHHAHLAEQIAALVEQREEGARRDAVPSRYLLVHDTDLAMLEGHIIGIYSGTPPLLTPDDMDEFNRRFDHIRSRHEQLVGIDLDAARAEEAGS